MRKIGYSCVAYADTWDNGMEDKMKVANNDK
ncbi:hypothetical protein SAMN04487780_1268 [Bacillus thuringiensis]|nr:hypothetical protein SAMN04487780_1268 [Bacillus thuringiensis]